MDSVFIQTESYLTACVQSGNATTERCYLQCSMKLVAFDAGASWIDSSGVTETRTGRKRGLRNRAIAASKASLTDWSWSFSAIARAESG
jgi:hypothetical protein